MACPIMSHVPKKRRFIVLPEGEELHTQVVRHRETLPGNPQHGVIHRDYFDRRKFSEKEQKNTQIKISNKD